MSDKPSSKMTDEFFKKMEHHAAAEATRLRKPTHGKLRLIGTAIGVLVVILLAVWLHTTDTYPNGHLQSRMGQTASVEGKGDVISRR